VALVLGATGLVGGFCVEELLRSRAWTTVRTAGRRPVAVDDPRLDQRIVDFERLDEDAEAFRADDVFCCIGTTIARAGSRVRFRRVDLEYPLAAARLARERGARRFFLVSAVDADAGSRIFYNRVKGETEASVRALGFETLVIARPSLLLGERDEVRTAERIGQRLAGPVAWLMRGPLAPYRPVHARDVARALVSLASDAPPGVHILPSDLLTDLARAQPG
jgi:uncharacterized protein YbjT (DUF2867 family)